MWKRRGPFLVVEAVVLIDLLGVGSPYAKAAKLAYGVGCSIAGTLPQLGDETTAPKIQPSIHLYRVLRACLAVFPRLSAYMFETQMPAWRQLGFLRRPSS